MAVFRSVLAVAAALVVLTAPAGCSSDADDAPDHSSDGPGGAAGVPELEVRTVVTRVAGELTRPRRDRLADEVDAVVSRYLDAAYLDAGTAGDAPFVGFTAGARRSAERDAEVLSARSWTEADEVRARSATAFVAAVSPRGTPVGATARIALELDVETAGRTRPVTVQGRLLLTPTSDGWRIFGYDLARSDDGLRTEGRR